MMESQGAFMFIVILTPVPRVIFIRQKNKTKQRSMHTSNQLHVTGPFSYKIKEVG